MRHGDCRGSASAVGRPGAVQRMMPASLFEPFITRLERLGLPYFVTGSAAGIIYGEPRMTHDIDIVVGLTLRDVPRFVAAFPDDEFYCRPRIVRYIARAASSPS